MCSRHHGEVGCAGTGFLRTDIGQRILQRCHSGIEPVAAEHQSPGWRFFSQGGDHRLRAAPRVAGLLAILGDHRGADLLKHRSVGGDGFVNRVVGEACIGTGAESARFNCQHVDAERRDFLAQCRRDSLDSPKWSRLDHQPADQPAVEGEPVVQIDHAAWEVTLEVLHDVD